MKFSRLSIWKPRDWESRPARTFYSLFHTYSTEPYKHTCGPCIVMCFLWWAFIYIDIHTLNIYVYIYLFIHYFVHFSLSLCTTRSFLSLLPYNNIHTRVHSQSFTSLVRSPFLPCVCRAHCAFSYWFHCNVYLPLVCACVECMLNWQLVTGNWEIDTCVSHTQSKTDKNIIFVLDSESERLWMPPYSFSL